MSDSKCSRALGPRARVDTRLTEILGDYQMGFLAFKLLSERPECAKLSHHVLPERLDNGRGHGGRRSLFLRAVWLDEGDSIPMLQVVIAEVDDGSANLEVGGSYEAEVLLLEVRLDELVRWQGALCAKPVDPRRQVGFKRVVRRVAIALPQGQLQVLFEPLMPVDDGPLLI